MRAHSARRCFQSGVLAAVALAISLVVIYPAIAKTGSKPKPFVLRDDFTSGNLNGWQMPYPQDWKIISKSGLHYFHMLRSRPPGVPRRPLQFARLKDVNLGSFDLRLRLRRSTGSSLIVVFNYVDTLHFYYVHLSKDPASRISVHNGIFIVDGTARRRIAGKDASPALPDYAWHSVRVVRDVPSGSIKVYMNEGENPLFSAVDRTFTCGQIGLGSFGNTGDFADLRLRSEEGECSVAPQAH